MHKSLRLLLCASVFVASCGRDTPKTAPEPENMERQTAIAEDTEHQTTTVRNNTTLVRKDENSADPDPSTVMLGTWEGEMSSKKLSIVIEQADNNAISGYNTLGTTRRSIKGTYSAGGWDMPCGKAFQATLNEPGDDKNDGVFSIKFVGYEDVVELDGGPECKGNLKGVEAIGTWTSNNNKKVNEITLTKQQ